MDSTTINTINHPKVPILISSHISPENLDFDINMCKSLFAGAIAGAVSRTLTSPLERLKVIQQVSIAKQIKQKNVFYLLRQMWRDEGFLSYWKGNGTNVLRIAPYSAIQFFSNDYYKSKFMFEGSHNPMQLLLCGGLSGMTSTIFCYPLDLVRAILTVQTNKLHYDGMGHAFRHIMKNEGFVGLYKGLVPTLIGIAPYVAINFTVFDILKSIYLPKKSDPFFDVINLILGAGAGAAAATITYPLDVVRRRMQLQGVAGVDLPQYKNTRDCLKQILKNEGFLGFYKGLTACYLKVIPAMAISFMTYERLRVILKFDPPKQKVSFG